MKNNEIRNGVRIRKHFKTSTKISEDGLIVEKEFMDKNDGGKLKKYNPKIYVDSEGLKYIVNKQLGNIRIQNLVADCFCPPKPNDGKDYVLVHKDGNLLNDHYRNLEWIERELAYPYKQATQDMEVKMTHEIKVRKDGKIYQKGKLLNVGYTISDRDMDMVTPIEPFVMYEVHHKQWKRYECKTIGVDVLMEKAGYVNGNKKKFNDPVILHKDNDWMNFDSDNLEWTDKSDPRYKVYHNCKVDAKNALGRKLNGNEKWSYMEKQSRFQHI